MVRRWRGAQRRADGREETLGGGGRHGDDRGGLGEAGGTTWSSEDAFSLGGLTKMSLSVDGTTATGKKREAYPLIRLRCMHCCVRL